MCHKWIHFRETEGLGREAALGLEPVGSRTRSPPVARTLGLAPKPDLAETLRRRGEPRSPWLARTRGCTRCAPAPRPGARLSRSREAEDRHESCCCPPGQGPGCRAAAGPTHTHQVVTSWPHTNPKGQKQQEQDLGEAATRQDSAQPAARRNGRGPAGSDSPRDRFRTSGQARWEGCCSTSSNMGRAPPSSDSCWQTQPSGAAQGAAPANEQPRGQAPQR